MVYQSTTCFYTILWQNTNFYNHPVSDTLKRENNPKVISEKKNQSQFNMKTEHLIFRIRTQEKCLYTIN